MTSADPERLPELFARASELPPAERERFLAQDGVDRTLAASLRALLASDAAVGASSCTMEARRGQSEVMTNEDKDANRERSTDMDFVLWPFLLLERLPDWLGTLLTNALLAVFFAASLSVPFAAVASVPLIHRSNEWVHMLAIVSVYLLMSMLLVGPSYLIRARPGRPPLRSFLVTWRDVAVAFMFCPFLASIGACVFTLFAFVVGLPATDAKGNFFWMLDHTPLVTLLAFALLQVATWCKPVRKFFGWWI